MTAISEELRIDIREAIGEAAILIEAVGMGLEMVLTKSTERDVRVSINALGRFVSQAGKVMEELAGLIEELSAAGEGAPTEEGNPVLESAMDALRFYAGKTGGERAKKALATIEGRGKRK